MGGGLTRVQGTLKVKGGARHPQVRDAKVIVGGRVTCLLAQGDPRNTMTPTKGLKSQQENLFLMDGIHNMPKLLCLSDLYQTLNLFIA